MITDFNEVQSRITKTLRATSGNYQLSATAVIENDIIISMSGNVTDGNDEMNPMGVTFDAYRMDGKLKVNYHNIASDERETLDIISAMVDAIIARYQ